MKVSLISRFAHVMFCSAGNCWFVAAASLLVNGPRQQFERVVPQDQGFNADEYAGRNDL